MSRIFETLVRDVQAKLHLLFLRKSDRNPGRMAMIAASEIPWSWVAVSVARVLSQYPTGLTTPVLISVLELMWERTFTKRVKGFDKSFGTIQTVYDSSTANTFLLEVMVMSWELIHGAKNYLITVTDEVSIREMDVCMHPKYSQWIDYPHLFIGRKIRMVCPPKANAPVINKYHDMSYSRRQRVALIPPTDLIMIMLSRGDKDFVQREFPEKIRDIAHSTDYRLWLKIIHVENIVHTTATPSLLAEEGSKIQRTDIFMVDMSSESVPVVLSLYDQQTELSTIFHRNDYIGLYKPKLRYTGEADSQEVAFEYANDTVLFLMPEKEAQEAQLAKVNLESIISAEEATTTDPKKDIVKRDEEGFLDCANYSARIYVKDLVHRMLNVTLLGRVVGLANNNPYHRKDKQSMDRYALRIADSTGMMDITLWEDAGRDSRKLRIGHYVLLDHLVTSDKHQTGEKKDVWYVNGSQVCGTKMYNISALSCLLTSTSFRCITPLWHAKETCSDHFQVEGFIAGWDVRFNDGSFISSEDESSTEKVDFMDYSLGDRVTTSAHIDCLLPIQSLNKVDCEFCGRQIGNDVVHIFRPKSSSPSSNRDWEGWIEWYFDDGTSLCKVYGGEERLQKLLNVTAHHFRLMSHRSQLELLNSVIGLSILGSLSGNDTSAYRFDQLTLFEPTQQECRDMLESMDKK